jgi:hypothetical protein
VEFTKENPSCIFTVPDRPTVRQQMEYFSATAGAAGSQILTRYWLGAKVLIQDWKCDELPKFDVDINSIDNPSQTEIMIWAAMQVKAHMDGLENIPKN